MSIIDLTGENEATTTIFRDDAITRNPPSRLRKKTQPQVTQPARPSLTKRVHDLTLEDTDPPSTDALRSSSGTTKRKLTDTEIQEPLANVPVTLEFAKRRRTSHDDRIVERPSRPSPESTVSPSPSIHDTDSITRPCTKERISSVSSVDDVTEIIDLVDDIEDEDIAESIEASPVNQIRRPKTTKRIPRILDPQKYFRSAISRNGMYIGKGTFVEFQDGSFMKVHAIDKSKDGSILIGPVYLRIGALSPTMPKHRDSLSWGKLESEDKDTRLPLHYRGGLLLNELVQKVKTIDGETKDDFGLWRRPARDVIKTRTLRLTNQPYNDLNCVSEGHARALGVSEAHVEEVAELTCRWIDVTAYKADGKLKEQYLVSPSTAQTDQHWSTPCEKLREEWRGPTLPLSDRDPITFADAFCGAGGMSCGARQAGLSVKLAFDKDEAKIATYRANHGECKSLVLSVDEFVKVAKKKDWNVDVLHLSPPCQSFSPANRHINPQKDEQNEAPLLGLAEVIKVLRPRIVTVEQTHGLFERERHQLWFNALIHQFTELGFSLRWSKLRCAEYGVPQLRRRLFVIAAAPGEALPSFPEPTHKVGDVTIRDALEIVEREHAIRPLSHHDTRASVFAVPKLPFSPDQPAKTITCSGGNGNYHPSGLRNYTPREELVIQTFTVRYRTARKRDGSNMSSTEIKIQAGNAVPPVVGEALLRSIAKSLRATDRDRRREMARYNARNAVMLG